MTTLFRFRVFAAGVFAAVILCAPGCVRKVAAPRIPPLTGPEAAPSLEVAAPEETIPIKEAPGEADVPSVIK